MLFQLDLIMDSMWNLLVEVWLGKVVAARDDKTLGFKLDILDGNNDGSNNGDDKGSIYQWQ